MPIKFDSLFINASIFKTAKTINANQQLNIIYLLLRHREPTR